MRVIVTASTFPRRRNDDLPAFVWEQVRHLSQTQSDLEVLVLAPHDAEAKRCEQWNGVTIRRFRYFLPERLQKLVYPAIWPNIQRSPWLVLQVPFLLVSEFAATLRTIRRFQPDMVYSHWFMPQALACGAAAAICGVPHAFTSHSRDVEVMRKIPWLGPATVRFIVDRTVALTVVSERSKAALKSFFDDEAWPRVERKIAVLPMGVDLSEWQRQLASASSGMNTLRPPRPCLLFVGRLVHKKGVQYLMEALTIEPLEARKPQLFLLGEGPLRTELEELSHTLGIEERVHFRGYVRGPKKAAYFREADLVVIPSIVTDEGDAEGMPVVLLEALGAAKICIATDASNAPEIVTSGREGFIVPQRNAAALSDAILRALDLSPEEKETMSERASQRAVQFDWSVLAQRHVEHLFAGHAG